MFQKSYIFLGIFIAFLFGIAIFFIFLSDIFLSVFMGCFLFLCGIFLSVLYKKNIFFVCIIFLSVFFGIFLSFFHSQSIENIQRSLNPFFGITSKQEVKILEISSRKDFSDVYEAKLQKISDISLEDKNVHILVEIPKNFTLQSGDIISFSAKLRKFEDFNGFAYEKYMLSQNLYARENIIAFEKRSFDKPFFLFQTLSSLRGNLLMRITNIFPQREAIFLAGILLGARENIPTDIKTQFNNSGLTHFIAVSGFNITLCIIFFGALFSPFPLWIRGIGVISSIILFSFFVGLGAPVVRAAIMGILGYLFLIFGKQGNQVLLLLFCASLMVFFSPLSLLYDVSLQLSFLAVLGIIFTQHIWKKAFFFLPEFAAIREAFIMTFSALVFTLPLMMFQFGQVSLISPLANVAVTWTIPLAMLTGTIALILDFISPLISGIFGIIPWIFLKYDMLVVGFFGNMPKALLHFEFGLEKYFYEVLYFILIVYVLSLYHIKYKKQF